MTDATPKNVRQRTRSTRQRKRKVAVTDLVPVVEDGGPDDPLNPGPQVNHPPLPRSPDGNVMPLPPARRLRMLYTVDRVAFEEFLLNNITAMMLSQRPRDDIARTFGVDLQTVDRWISWATVEQRSKWMGWDQADRVSMQEASMRRLIGYAWQSMGSTRDGHVKNRWASVILRSEQLLLDIQREARGYRSLPVRRAYDEDDRSGDQGIRELAATGLSFMKETVDTIPRLPSAEDDLPDAQEGLD